MPAAWYRGDLHAHTDRSDGYYPPAQLVGLARAERLDFFAITDHNSAAAFDSLGHEPGMTILPGVEVTLRQGHFNVFGALDRLRAIAALPGRPSTVQPNDPLLQLNALVRYASEHGLLVSINHPLLEPWAWQAMATELRYVDCLEIWNDPSWPDNQHANPQTVALWSAALDAGYRITAVGGSDYHRPQPRPGEHKPPDRLGLPSTYVYADTLSGAAILAALRARRAYVSLGPRLYFEATVGTSSYGIGDELGTLYGPIAFDARAEQLPNGARMQLLTNNRVVAEAAGADGHASLSFETAVEPDQPAWYRLDLRDRHGQFLALTNPIFAGPRRAPSLRTFGELVAAALG